MCCDSAGIQTLDLQNRKRKSFRMLLLYDQLFINFILYFQLIISQLFNILQFLLQQLPVL